MTDHGAIPDAKEPALNGAAKVAANKAFLAEAERQGYGYSDPQWHALIAALRAAAPATAATERERIASRPFVLVWRDERGTEICRSAAVMPGTVKIGIPLDAQSADLITEPPTRTEGNPPQ